MPDNDIESFVDRLVRDGVDAGRQEADRILAAARDEAERIVAAAREEAARLRDDAQRDAAATLARGRSELELAARDVTLELRAAIGGAIRAVLARGVSEKLRQDDFLGQLLREIVLAYAAADAAGGPRIEIDVAADKREKLVAWTLGEIGGERAGGAPSVELRSTLNRAGFEYRTNGAVVDVTVDSVVEHLAGLIGPSLRELLRQAVAEHLR
jgi:V/A-type H+-transporting ATPase subunit E